MLNSATRSRCRLSCVGEGLGDPVLDIEAVGHDAGLTVVTHLRQHRAVHRDIAAFDEIVGASKNHRVPTFSIARALVALAENSGVPDGSPDRAIRTASGTRILATVRSHDQWNTTIYSGNDRYRGIKNLRTLIFMNRHDMRNRDIKEFDDVDIVATARDGSTRSLHRYKAIPYDIPRGCAAGYMPEMNVLCAIDDYSTQSDQHIMMNLKVTVRRSI
jgi:anaerobic selenocysteine-containing dehydrogenase